LFFLYPRFHIRENFRGLDILFGNQATIRGYSGDDGEVVIPIKVDGIAAGTGFWMASELYLIAARLFDNRARAHFERFEKKF